MRKRVIAFALALPVVLTMALSLVAISSHAQRDIMLCQQGTWVGDDRGNGVCYTLLAFDCDNCRVIHLP